MYVLIFLNLFGLNHKSLSFTSFARSFSISRDFIRESYKIKEYILGMFFTESLSPLSIFPDVLLVDHTCPRTLESQNHRRQSLKTDDTAACPVEKNICRCMRKPVCPRPQYYAKCWNSQMTKNNGMVTFYRYVDEHEGRQ